jgi:hypothetical protein
VEKSQFMENLDWWSNGLGSGTSLSRTTYICFGAKFDQSKFDEVIRVCHLQQDINVWPQKENTLIGDKGIKLRWAKREIFIFFSR